MASTRVVAPHGDSTETPRKTRKTRQVRTDSSGPAEPEHNPVEAKRDVVNQARDQLHNKVAEALAQYTPEKILETTMSQLKQDANTVICKMLGLDNKWGKWEVDHCNGRTSHITAFIDAQAKISVADWLKENITAEMLTKAVAPKSIRDVIGRSYAETYHRTVQHEVRKLMDTHAVKEAQLIAKGLINELRKQCTPGETADWEVDGEEG